jgi:hypothetical protein
VTTRHTPRESFWRGHWAAIDGSAIATENDDANAFARGAERGAAALAEAMRCNTYRERWAWITRYVAMLGSYARESVSLSAGASAWRLGDSAMLASNREDQ